MVKIMKGKWIKEIGFTLAELLVSLSMASFVVAGSISLYTDVALTYRDLQIRQITDSSAQALLNLVGDEIRDIGNGIPYDQPNFEVNDDLEDQSATVAARTVQQPFDAANTNASQIVYKLNEKGLTFVLAGDFDPTGTSTISLDSVDGLLTGDAVYIANASLGEEDGFYGTIDSINTVGKTITIDSTYYRSPGASFDAGSTLEPVATVTVTTTSGDVTRDSGLGAAIFAENASISFEYYDKVTDTAYPVPLSSTAITTLMDGLGYVKVTVSVTSDKKLRRLEPIDTQYTATASQVFGLRSFNF